MNCKDFEVRLQSFLDKDSSDSERVQMELHLKNCPECAALKRDLELLEDLAHTELRVKAPADFDHLIQKRIGGCVPRRWVLPLAWSTAAALAFTLIFFFNMIPEFHSQERSNSQQVQPAPVVLPGDPDTPGMHVFVPGEQRGILVRVPTTVRITHTQLTQDFFLSEVSH
ncbi:MAG TPA: zf-HC2 domain-containing protein [Acidobacteriota bacterium]|jgi:anti-sigma factor RsiW